MRQRFSFGVFFNLLKEPERISASGSLIMAYQPAKLRHEAEIIQFPLRLRRRGVIVSLLARLVRWLDRPPRPPDLPPYLLEDIGLPPDSRPGWQERPSAHLDPTVIYAWTRK